LTFKKKFVKVNLVVFIPIYFTIKQLQRKECRMKEIILSVRKGRELFIFSYESGQESELLEVLIEQADNPEINFDWFDAVMISSKVADDLIVQAKELLDRVLKER